MGVTHQSVPAASKRKRVSQNPVREAPEHDVHAVFDHDITFVLNKHKNTVMSDLIFQKASEIETKNESLSELVELVPKISANERQNATK